MRYTHDDDWAMWLVGIFILGGVLSIAGFSFLSVLGFLGIENQQYIFSQIDFLIGLIQEIVRWIILPVYIFVVGLIGVFILSKTEWNSEEEESNQD